MQVMKGLGTVGTNSNCFGIGFRFLAGCNLWSGREEDRTTAPYDFCDTDVVGTDGPGGRTSGGRTIPRAGRRIFRRRGHDALGPIMKVA